MRKRFGSKLLAGTLSGAMAFTSCFANYVPVYAEQSVNAGGTVYISISDDASYVSSDTEAHDGEVMAYIPVSLDTVAQAIDLEDYDYGDFQYDADDDGDYETTLLHVFLYVLENYYSGGTEDLQITGSAGSTYLQNGFWGHDENLTYYVNGQYPLAGPAWGATSDQIVLEDGDFIDVSMYSDWSFYNDEAAGYHYFTDTTGAISHEFQATAGEALTVGYARTVTDWNDTYSTTLTPDNNTIYYGTMLYGEANAVETVNGSASITFPAEGTYYMWADGKDGASGTTVSAPAYAKVEVEAGVESNTHAITTEVKNASGEISGMYTMENVIVTEQEDGTYLVRMHQASVNRDYMAIVPDQTDASKDLATNHQVDWYIGTGDGYTFTIPVASLEDTVYLSFSKASNVAAGKAWSNVMALTFDTESMTDTEEAEVTADEMNVSPAVVISNTHAITTEVKNASGEISGMYTMENVIVTEQEDGTYLVRMHQASVNRDYMAIVPDQTDASKDLATSHQVDWYIGTGDGYTFTIPVASLEDTVYLSFSKASNVAAGKAWSNVMALTFDTESMTDTEEAEVTADEMNVSPAVAPETVVTELTASSLTAMFKAVSGSIEQTGNDVVLRFALSGTGYQDIFVGTYEEANATTSGETIDNSNWVHYTLNEAGKYEFVIPIEEGQTFIPICGLSASKAAAGEYKWYPRQLTIDYEALTLVSDDYNHTSELALTDEDAAFAAASAGLTTVGGPNSNNYKEILQLTMENADLNAAYIGTAEEAAEAESVIAIDETNTFAIPVLANKMGGAVDYDYMDQDTVVAFRSAEDGSWTEQIINVSKSAGTVVITAPPVPVTEVDVTIRSQADNTYLAPINETETVASDLAESYGFTDSLPGQVTALDVLVKAHEDIFGEEFTAETAGDYLAVSSSGYVSKLFAVATYANGFAVNGGYPNDGTESAYGGYNGTTVTTTAIEDGDVVDFLIYGDDSFYGDYFTYIESESSVYAGSEMDVTVKGVMYMMAYMYADAEEMAEAAEPLENAAIGWVDPATGTVTAIADALTDEDGNVTITTPSEPGTYYLSAMSYTEEEYEEVYCILNPVSIEVTEAPVPVTVETTITISNTSDSAALYAKEDEAKENNLLADIEKVGTTYTVTVDPGEYLLEAFTGETSNGTMVLNINADNKAFTVYTVTAYCSTSGWTYGTDYTIEKLQVLSGGEKATVIREITMGDSTTAGRKTFLVLNGDTYSFYGTPMGDRTSAYVPTYKTGTVTAANYATASFAMATKAGLTVTVPYADTDNDGENDYILEVGQMTNYYIYTYLDPSSDTVDEEAATETQTFEAAKSGAYFYRVTNPLNDDAVTYGNYMTCSADSNAVTVTAADMRVGDSSSTSKTVIKGFSENAYDTGDIYLNINEKGYLNLASGSSYNLYAFRNWLAIEGISNAKVIEPDFHVEVIDLDGSGAVSVTEKTENNASKHSYELKANNAGTAIVLVTYDAMVDPVAMGTGKYFSAIWPENTGVFVVTVDGSTGIDTGMTINEGKNATSKLSGDAYDADLDVLYYAGDEGAEYTFTPEAGTEVTMSVGQLTANSMTFGAFTSEGVTMNEDGSVTLSGLTSGKTIVKLTNGGRTEYQVLKALKLSYTVTNQDGTVVATDAGMAEGAVVKANDTLKVKFDTVYMPANKLSGIYNMAGTIKYTGEDGSAFNGTGNQYLFASTEAAQTITVKIPKFWTEETYSISGIVSEGGFGSQYGSHRILTYEAGKSPNFTAGSYTGIFGALPTITFEITPTEFLSASFVLKDTAGETIDPSTVTINVKDFENSAVQVNENGSFQASSGTYSYTINAAGYMYNYGSVTLTDDGENVFEITLTASTENAWDGASMTAPAQDEDGVYLISNGAELKWFQNEITVNKNKTINGKLTADIDLASYPWTPIGTTSAQLAGTLDGNNHAINNLYVNATSYPALIGCLTGTVKDLTVNGEVTSTSGNLAGIVAYAQGVNANNPAHIINCVNNANITQNNASATSGTIGGIAGYMYYASIENCTNNGTIQTNSTSSTLNGVGGIVGYVMNYPVTITGCKNTGDVTGRSLTGGIVGYCSGSKPVIEKCYNTGSVTGYNYTAGIVGDLRGATLAHCYNIGEVALTEESGTLAPIANDNTSSYSVSDAWYLNSFEGETNCGTAVSETELQATSIEGFGACCTTTPALLWEDAEFHQKGEAVVTAPTCTEGGYTTYTCPNCEKTFTDDYLPANGHTPVITEQHIGYGTGTCSVCGIDLTVWDDDRLQALTYDETALSAISLADTTYPWIQTDNGLMSGNKGVDSSTSATSLSFTLTGYANVSFAYSVSSEARYDKLTLTMNDGSATETIANAISGSETGTYEKMLTPGTYTLSMSFNKDSSSASGKDCGEITDFTIEALNDLMILAQPENIASAKKGDRISYSVTAINAASYQWQYSKNGQTWTNSTLATAQTESITLTTGVANINNKYRCKITGTDGTVIYTDVVAIEEIIKLVITQQPVNWNAADGKAATFSVTAENAASFQWMYSKDEGITWYKTSITSVTEENTNSISLTLSASNAANVYRCLIKSSDGSSVYSDTVGFTGVPVITGQPESVNYNAGSTAVFTVTVSEPEACSFQWFYSKDGGTNWYKSTASSATTASLSMTMKSSNAGMIYKCKVTANGFSVFSQNANFEA